MEPESFTKGDLEQFLEEFDSNEEFRKAYKPQLKEEPVSARVKAALENPIEVKA